MKRTASLHGSVSWSFRCNRRSEHSLFFDATSITFVDFSFTKSRLPTRNAGRREESPLKTRTLKRPKTNNVIPVWSKGPETFTNLPKRTTKASRSSTNKAPDPNRTPPRILNRLVKGHQGKIGRALSNRPELFNHNTIHIYSTYVCNAAIMPRQPV